MGPYVKALQDADHAEWCQNDPLDTEPLWKLAMSILSTPKLRCGLGDPPCRSKHADPNIVAKHQALHRLCENGCGVHLPAIKKKKDPAKELSALQLEHNKKCNKYATPRKPVIQGLRSKEQVARDMKNKQVTLRSFLTSAPSPLVALPSTASQNGFGGTTDRPVCKRKASKMEEDDIDVASLLSDE